MGLARRLQPTASRDGPSSEPPWAKVVDLGIDDQWGRADGLVALLSWDGLSDALSSGSDDLANAWLTLTSFVDGASLVLVRAAVMQTTASHTDVQRLAQARFRPRGRTGTWVRPVDPHDLDAVVRVLKGPLDVPHPRALRFTLQARDASRVRLLFGPLGEQQRRPPAGAWPRAPGEPGPACRRCGQPMIDPLSIARGYGPDCWKVLTEG